MINIQLLQKQHVNQVAEIASQSFSGLKDPAKAQQWVKCNFNAFPRMQYFTAKQDQKIIGYILWMEKGGFREKSVWELEQIAVHKNWRAKGVGTMLVEESLGQIKKALKKRGSKLKLIEVTTGTSNQAQALYKKTLGAKSEAIIKDFFRDDEIIMISRY